MMTQQQKAEAYVRQQLPHLQKGWRAFYAPNEEVSNPEVFRTEEAVAKLWLALNSKAV